jgi:adenine phosphoribosyltransferase
MENIDNFLKRHGITDFSLRKDADITVLDIDDRGLAQKQRAALQLHFNFYDIFVWSEQGVENIALWEQPARVVDMVEAMRRFFPIGYAEALATVEAKGFLIGGAAGYATFKPLYTVRKYKPLFAGLPGWRKRYTTWNGQEEEFYLFAPGPGEGKRLLLIDDVLETGNSLAAAVDLLAEAGAEVVGAFYLIDAATPEVRGQFKFPIRSLLRYHDLFGNQPIEIEQLS